MDAWKSSTLLVLAAFAVSVLLLFAKANMVERRSAPEEMRVSNDIYTTSALDPNLRDRERADAMRRRPVTAVTASSKSTVDRPANAPEAAPAKPFVNPFPPHPVPANQVYYVVAATFGAPDNARRGLTDLQRKGLDKAFIGTFDEGKWFSVIAGTFAKEESAHFMVKDLERKHGVKAYVYHRRDDDK